ncbi:MAG TPA: VOC family protein [Streptosporangiaceae bacterium]|nr:VOC family protein [Streptosporangiaceae bacterium]
MTTRLVHVVVDAADPLGLAEFWAAALRWEIAAVEPDEVRVSPAGFDYPGAAALPLLFVPVSDPKAGKNTVHLDLATTSADHQAAEASRLLSLGATSADIGQGAVPWVVLADPEGNELCVLDPRPAYRDTGPVAAVVMDCPDPGAIAGFWQEAAGWDVCGSHDELVSLRSPAGTGPFLELLKVPGRKSGKDRVHLDVAPYPDGSGRAEVSRLTRIGAVPADVGQGDVSWAVLADPVGHEFCVLSPR